MKKGLVTLISGAALLISGLSANFYDFTRRCDIKFENYHLIVSPKEKGNYFENETSNSYSDLVYFLDIAGIGFIGVGLNNLRKNKS